MAKRCSQDLSPLELLDRQLAIECAEKLREAKEQQGGQFVWSKAVSWVLHAAV